LFACIIFLVQLLHKFSVRAAETSAKLMKVIKNPITDHLPAGCRKIATSFSASKPIKPTELVIQDAPIAFVIGAMAHGQVILFLLFI
jgi:rRNA small subunit pseudouridine methyltransferase Nep1